MFQGFYVEIDPYRSLFLQLVQKAQEFPIR